MHHAEGQLGFEIRQVPIEESENFERQQTKRQALPVFFHEHVSVRGAIGIGIGRRGRAIGGWRVGGWDGTSFGFPQML